MISVFGYRMIIIVLDYVPIICLCVFCVSGMVLGLRVSSLQFAGWYDHVVDAQAGASKNGRLKDVLTRCVHTIPHDTIHPQHYTTPIGNGDEFPTG